VSAVVGLAVCQAGAEVVAACQWLQAGWLHPGIRG
jgi:hypothetical protein